jgi:hypothetical protein
VPGMQTPYPKPNVLVNTAALPVRHVGQFFARARVAAKVKHIATVRKSLACWIRGRDRRGEIRKAGVAVEGAVFVEPSASGGGHPPVSATRC